MPKQFHFGFKESGFRKMLMKDLAEQLGISGSMVSRLAKRGMPTDSLERAQRWRKRHLEQGRVKGQRIGTSSAPVVRAPAPGGVLEVARIEGISPDQHIAAVSAAGQLLEAAMFGADQRERGALVGVYRGLLRSLPSGLRPRLPVRVWVALLDYLLDDESELRTASDQAEPVGIEEVASIIGAGREFALPAEEWFAVACDWAGVASEIQALPDSQ